MNYIIRIFIFLIFILLTTIPHSLFGQLEGGRWYFGTYAGLDFNTVPPTPLYDGKLNTYEGCSSISDKFGNLLFYTDGQTVYDQNHDIMPNGTGLAGHTSSVMSSIVCPKPGSWNPILNRYDGYIIGTLDYEIGSNGVRWSEVNLTANNGLGEVVEATKNTYLFGTNTVEGANFAQHENGFDYWFITKEVGTSKWMVYPVTTEGVINNPVVSYTGPDAVNAWGTVKVSPDSKTMAFSNKPVGVHIYDFNNETGELTYRYGHDSFVDNYYSLEFSPNNRFVYFTLLEDENIYQLDLNAVTVPDFLGSLEVVGSTSNDSHFYKVGALQMAPDHKIYLTLIGSDYLGMIECPDMKGEEANYVDNAVNIGGTNINGQQIAAKLGLPSFPGFLFNNPKYIIAAQECFTQNVHFGLSNSDQTEGVSWYVTESGESFPNTPTSTDEEFTLYDLAVGEYDIKVLVDYDCYSDSLFRTIKVGEYNNDPIELGENHCFEEEIMLHAGSTFDLYEWQDGSTDSVFYVTSPGIYSCEIGVKGVNRIFNQQFDLGNIGFESGYDYAANTNLTPGKYYVGTGISNSSWQNCSDHSAENGEMLIVSTNCNIETNFWCQKVFVEPNTDYYFSAFIGKGNANNTQPIIALKVNGEIVSTHSLSTDACEWEEMTFIWNSGPLGLINICLSEISSSCDESIIIVDDISFNNICYKNEEIEIYENPKVVFDGENLTGCSPLCPEFTVQTTDATTSITDYLWTVSNEDGVLLTSDHPEFNQCIENNFLSESQYDVTLQVTSENGCTDEYFQENYLTIYPSPHAAFTFSPNNPSVLDTKVDFQNHSTNADSYEWIILGSENYFSNEKNPSIDFSSDNGGGYSVMLIAHNNYGCVDTAVATLIVKDEVIFYVPNTFTPNADGHNDTFKPILSSGIDIYSYVLTIYNRWGELIFESYDHNVGWDATYGNKLVQDDIYVWKLGFKERTSDKSYIYTGHVTILR